jgi:cytochrome b561/mono/diheme cytochrome c family protein
MTSGSEGERARRYSTVAILLHWLTAALLAFQIVLGWRVANADGADAAAWLPLHKSLGISILVLTVARLAWRWMNPAPPPVGLSAFERRVSSLVHALFYALLLVLPLTGWAASSASRAGAGRLFGMIPWPRFPFVSTLSPATQDLVVGGMENAHQAAAWITIALLVLHIAGALKHLLKRDPVVPRMLPLQSREWGFVAVFVLAIVAFMPTLILQSGPVEPARPRPTELAAADLYLDVVHPALQSHCAACHNDQKTRGGLSFAAYESLREGGANGPVVRAGDPEHSELYKRVTLPPDDHHFMPKNGKPPLRPEQVEAIKWWIAQRAPASLPLGTADIPNDLRSSLMAAMGLKVAPKVDEKDKVPQVAAADAAAIASLQAAGFGVRLVKAGNGLLDVELMPGRRAGEQELAQLAPVAAQLRTLNLRNAGISDASLASIGSLPHLKLLRIEGNPVTDSGLQALRGLDELETINLGETRVTRKGLASLSRLPALQRVYAWGAAAGTESFSIPRVEGRIDVIVSAPASRPGKMAPTSASQMEAMAKLIAASQEPVAAE